MSREYSAKGGRDGGKRRKNDAKKRGPSGGSSNGADGKDGVDAWSADSMKDFASDQALLADHVAKLQGDAAPAAAVEASAAAASAAPAAAAAAVSAAPAASASSSPPAVFSPLGAASALHVDGSLLEGGGQVLRNAIAYSALLGLPINITKIRAGRMSGGGLKAQHLKGLQLVSDITSGGLRGANINSREVEYEPGAGDFAQLKNPRIEFTESAGPQLQYNCDIGTAGATGLLIQIALPVALFLPYPVSLELRGGTNASMAPVFDYTQLVFAPVLAQLFGLNIKCELVTRGFFPKGGGIVRLHTQPVAALNAVNFTQRGEIVKFTGLAFVTHRLPVNIAERMAAQATKQLQNEFGRKVSIEITARAESAEQSVIGEGVCMILLAHTSTGCILAASSLGEKGLPAEDVASKCVDALVANLETGGCVDEYLQDQLILFMALAKGTSTIKTGPLTLHTRTCLYWAQRFTGCKITVVAAKGNNTLHTPEQSDCAQTFLVQIQGVGYQSRFRKA